MFGMPFALKGMILILFPLIVLVLTGVMSNNLLSRRLTVAWLKVSKVLPKDAVFGLALATGTFAPLNQEGDPIGRLLLRILGVLAVVAAVMIFRSAVFGPRSVPASTEREGSAGSSASLWFGAFLTFAGILFIVGSMIRVPADIWNSTPVRFVENLFLQVCGDLCD